jgi:hypothetical protein
MTLDRIKQWFRTATDGEEPVATPPQGVAIDEETDDDQIETSTNAQVAGAEGEPWNT